MTALHGCAPSIDSNKFVHYVENYAGDTDDKSKPADDFGAPAPIPLVDFTLIVLLCFCDQSVIFKVA